MLTRLNPLARVRLGYARPYYRRLFRIVWQETRGRLTVLTVTSVAFVVLNVIYARVFTKQGVGAGLEIGFASVASLWFVVGVWFFFTIPPRIESDLQRKEESLQLLSQRWNVANELRNNMNRCRGEARRAREAVIEASGQGHTVEPASYHQTALMTVKDAEERLGWLSQQTGQVPYDRYLADIIDAVSSEKCATVEDAIAQLEAVARVIERQLMEGIYQ